MQRLAAIVVIIVLASAGYIGYQYKTTKQLPDFQKMSSTITNFTSQVSEKAPKVQNTTTDASSQLQTLTQRANEVGQHAQNVLGSSIQVNEEEKKPIHESALEYGQYIYCKQVVMDYEKAIEESKVAKE
jgi:hypothetical protein